MYFCKQDMIVIRQRASCKHKLRFKFLYELNIHYNLGIFLDENGDIIGNSQYGYYLFQDNNILKKKIEEVENLTDTKKIDYQFAPEEYFEYGKYCGKIIGRNQ